MLSKNGSSKPAQRDALDDNTDTVYDVIILGGDDAGLGAVWAASQLQLKTLLVVQHRAEIGGDFVQIATDLSVYPPTIGGWNMVYDGYARRTCNHPAGGTHQSTRTAPPGPTSRFIDDLIASSRTITVLEGFLPQPGGARQLMNGTLLSVDLVCLLYTSPSPRDGLLSRMPSSA